MIKFPDEKPTLLRARPWALYAGRKRENMIKLYKLTDSCGKTRNDYYLSGIASSAGVAGWRRANPVCPCEVGGSVNCGRVNLRRIESYEKAGNQRNFGHHSFFGADLVCNFYTRKHAGLVSNKERAENG